MSSRAIPDLEQLEDLDLPTYISSEDEDIHEAMARAFDDQFPAFREKVATLIRHAYIAGVVDGIEHDARSLVARSDADDEVARSVRRSLWERAEEYRREKL
jgi:hypothetical protein